MIIQTVAKSGAVSILPTISSAPVSVASPDNNSPLQSVTSPHLSCRRLHADGVQPGGFFNVGLGLKDDDKSVYFYEVGPAEGAGPSRVPAFDGVFVVPDESVLYIDGSRPITQHNKESLTTILDLADEAGCAIVRACIGKDAVGLKDIVRSYGACGFSVGAEMGDFLVMTFDI